MARRCRKAYIAVGGVDLKMSSAWDRNEIPDTSERLPMVSVVIPAYNAESYIAEAVDSVLEQDYPNKEIIIVDDGSTDQTVKILEQYGDRIRLIKQANSGSAVARNAGISAASGSYITFLDSDDVWLPGKLTVQVAYMERHPEIDLIQARWQVWEQELDGSFSRPAEICPVETKALPPPIPELSGWIYHLLLLDCIVWTSVVMVRRRLVNAVGGFDDRYARGQDYQYWLRASRYTPIHKLDCVMALYRQHSDNSTHGCPRRNYAIEIIDSAIAEWGLAGPDGSKPGLAPLRRRRARLWGGYAHKQLRAGKAREASRSFARALRIDPLVPRFWLMLAASIFAIAGLLETRRTD